MIAVLDASASAPAPRSPQSCDLNALRPVEIGQNSFVYARDGSLLGSIPAERNREPVTTRAACRRGCRRRRSRSRTGASTSTAASTTSGIARAAWKDVTAGKVVEGGSTITQQLVRNLYTGQEKTFNRKLKEACLAIKLSRKWSKPKILDEYLNTVYYGNHAYGVEAAAQTYFSKHASQLTLLAVGAARRAAAGAVVYDPFHNPQAALDRRDEVLRALLANQRRSRRGSTDAGDPVDAR